MKKLVTGSDSSQGQSGNVSRSAQATPCPRPCLCFLLSAFCLFLTACQSLRYTSPSGERFTRTSIGTKTAISSLFVQIDTNGIRRVELQGYTNDETKAIGAITEAAIRAALTAK